MSRRGNDGRNCVKSPSPLTYLQAEVKRCENGSAVGGPVTHIAPADYEAMKVLERLMEGLS